MRALPCTFASPPSTAKEVTRTGLVVSPAGIVEQILPDSVAARWGEWRTGDEILTISGVPFRTGAPLMEQLTDGKDAYLARVRRVEKDHSGLRRALCSLMPASREWQSEEAIAKAWADAGDFQRCSF